MTPNFRLCNYNGIKLEFGHLITEARILALILTETEVFKLDSDTQNEKEVNLIRDQ